MYYTKSLFEQNKIRKIKYILRIKSRIPKLSSIQCPTQTPSLLPVHRTHAPRAPPSSHSPPTGPPTTPPTCPRARRAGRPSSPPSPHKSRRWLCPSRSPRCPCLASWEGARQARLGSPWAGCLRCPTTPPRECGSRTWRGPTRRIRLHQGYESGNKKTAYMMYMCVRIGVRLASKCGRVGMRAMGWKWIIEFILKVCNKHTHTHTHTRTHLLASDRGHSLPDSRAVAVKGSNPHTRTLCDHDLQHKHEWEGKYKYGQMRSTAVQKN